MKKSKSIALAIAAALCLTGGVAFEVEKKIFESSSNEVVGFKSGKEAIDQVRDNYKNGKYDQFLREMDVVYEGALGAGLVKEIGQMRSGANLNSQWLDKTKALQQERNAQLLNAISGDHSEFANKVKNFAESSDEENIVMYLHQMKPGDGKTSEVNKLVDIDLEYDVKSIYVDQSSLEGKDFGMDTRELQYALKMEQMDKMVLVAQGFEDKDLKDSVASFAKNVDTRMAKNWDAVDLYSVSSGKVAAQDETQKSVASILQSHQQKLSDMSKKFVTKK